MRVNREKIVSISCDVSDQDYVELFVDEFKEQEPHILLNIHTATDKNSSYESPIVLSTEDAQKLMAALHVSIQKLAEAKLTDLIKG